MTRGVGLGVGLVLLDLVMMLSGSVTAVDRMDAPAKRWPRSGGSAKHSGP